MRHWRLVLGLLIAACLLTGLASAQAPDEKQMNAYIDAMKKDLRTQKQSLVDQAMGLEAAQKSQFWSIYEGYQTALNAIWDQRIANIKKYAANYDKMTDAVADQLATAALDLEGQRSALRKKYYATYKEKMGARVAARFLQTEATLGYLMDLKISSEIPILQ